MSKNKTDPKIKDAIKDSLNRDRGIQAFLSQSLQSYDKLPMLEIIFEKFVRQVTTALRYLTSEPVEVEMVSCTSLRFGEYFKEIYSPSVIAVFQVIELENLGLIVMDSNLILTFVDILLGGSVSTAHKKRTQKVLTSIEGGITKQVIDVILHELSEAFEQICPATFVFERLESNPNFATISRPGDAVIAMQVEITIDDKREKFDVVIPYKTLEPIKEQMQQVFLGDKFGADGVWEENLLNVTQDVDLPLEAVIINKPSTLEEVANLGIGDTIVMDHKSDQDVIIRSGNIHLFTGKIGQADGKIAVDLQHIITDK